MLGEDGDFLHNITIDMEPEDGLIAVYGTGDESTPAPSDFGVANLRELIPICRENQHRFA